MSWLRRSTDGSVDVVIDTSTLFSALHNRMGNEAFLFELADIGVIRVHILDYVLDELLIVLARKGIHSISIRDLLDSYYNLFIHEMHDLTDLEIDLAKRTIRDVGDRPVFLFAPRMVNEGDDVYFISGDKGFFEPVVVELLKGRVMRTRTFLNMIGRD